MNLVQNEANYTREKSKTGVNFVCRNRIRFYDILNMFHAVNVYTQLQVSKA
jgi:hypothetical protein